MLKIIFFSTAVLLTSQAMGQQTLEKIMEKLTADEVPLITVSEVVSHPTYIRLDSREKEEYEVSHLPNSFFIGYGEFDEAEFTAHFPEKDATYVVYCSVGIRSGKIGRKLQELGYTDVRNLSGGIFKWVEEGHELLDKDEIATQKVHAYNRFWGMLLNKGEKVYGPVKGDGNDR
jgi:rhodanese-related sulfurtransferase